MAESVPELYLSVVAVSRNDDHGSNLRGRMQHFVDGFVAQCRRHQLDAELVLVEWNPPLGRPRLADALRWPEDPGPASIRIITVPPEVHAQFAHSSQLPLFQMIGKNVGIRRARGRFILATNVDILLDDAIVQYLRDRLRSGTVLRVDRYDVPAPRPDISFDLILQQCAKSFFNVNVRFGVFDARQRRILGLGDSAIARLRHLATEIRIMGIGRSRLWRAIRDVLSRPAQLYNLAGRIVASISSRAWLVLKRPAKAIRHAGRWLSRLSRLAFGLVGYVTGLLGPKSAASVRYQRLRWLHTNACGDFTLLARDDWIRLRGYPEWPIFSWHLDSAFMYAASVNNLSEVALGTKYKIYHLDHSAGSGWSPTGAALLFARLEAMGIPYLSEEELERWRQQIAADPQSAIVNGPAWGLADQPLPELQILPRFPGPAQSKRETSLRSLSEASRMSG
jgi:hypothetical protein